MPDVGLDAHLAEERSAAARALLRAPLLDAEIEPEAFRTVVRHATWLTDHFEQSCGWSLAVDPAAGFARLAKRAAPGSSVRPPRRTRGERAPFDRRRYQLLCSVCAELVRRPVTTVGLLAQSVTVDADLDTSLRRERAAFVDALRALIDWGAVRVTVGELDAFVDSEEANSILGADTARLHRLLVAEVAPSSLAEGLDVRAVTEQLRAEPRYGDPDAGNSTVGDETRTRAARHRLGRRVLDEPAVHLDELTSAERDYLANPSGRRWLRERVAATGFELEERAEGLVAVDPDRIATDAVFPAPHGNSHQLALLLVDHLVPTTPDGGRTLGQLDPTELRTVVDDILARFPGWARARRDPGGPEQLTAEAIELLVGFGLVRCEPDGTVTARPALARYRVGEPAAGPPNLLEGTS